MRKLHIFGVIVLALAFTGCGADEQEKAMRDEIANLNKFLNNLQTGLDTRKEEIASLQESLREKDSYSVRAQEQLQLLEEKIIASEKAGLDKMAGLEKKLEDTRQELMKADKELISRDQGHDAANITLQAKTKQLATEVDAKKKEIKDIRKELFALKSVVDQQTFQLLQLHQTEELEETGVTAE